MTDTIRVLLIEHNQNDYLLIQNLLSREHKTTFELQRLQSLEPSGSIETGRYDVCLLDHRFTLDPGFNSVREALPSLEGVPLIILTDEEALQAEAGRTYPQNAVRLVKGELSAASLQRAIRNVLEGKRFELTDRQAPTDYPYLAAAIANLSTGVLITDPRQEDNPLVFVNTAFTAITGYTPEETLGRNCRFLQHPDTDPTVLQSIRNALHERQTFKGTLLNLRKDGTSFHNSLVINPVFDERGELVNFVGLSEDVTAQVQMEAALRQSEKRFEGMVANVPGTLYRVVAHPDGTRSTLYVSRGCQDLFEIAPDEFQFDVLQSMVHADDRQSYIAGTAAARERHGPWHWQGRIVLASGKEKVIVCRGHPDVQENGDVVWDGLLMDVTQLMHAEEKARQLAAIVEGSSDAIIGKTLDGTITSWNAAAERIYGYTAEEMIGQSITRLLPPDRPNDVAYLLTRIAQGELVRSYETVRRAKDGTLLDVAVTVSPIRDGTGSVTGASAIAHDIRQRKEAERQLQLQVQRIQALRNIDMAITASLDLRVTLNVLLDQVTTHLHVDSASVLLLNQSTQRLEFVAGRGLLTSGLQRTRLRIGEGYAGRAAHERRMVYIPNLNNDLPAVARGPLFAAEGFVSYCAVPLITKGRVEGVLEVMHRTPLHADSDWMSFLEVLAGQAAIALENASLFNNLQHTNVELQLAYDSTLEGWSKALDLRDHETEGHTLRVTAATMALAHAMNLPDDLVHMRRGALLHDIGKMGVPDAILLKPGPLTDEEWRIMKMHPVYAYELLSPINFLRPALDIPYCHHEKWDGSGYPRGLKGEQIPLGARIFAIVDVWDALRSDRPYRAAWPDARVRDHIAKASGSHFDPRLVDIFLNTEL